MFTEIKTAGTLSIYIPCILSIMCLYIWWIGAYDYEDEFTLGILLVILGMLYICAIYVIMAQHSIISSCVILATLIIVITIAAVSKFKQKDGSQGKTFLCLGITPMISGICFASIGIFISYVLINVGNVTHGIV